MKITITPEVVDSLEELTGKKITRNGNQIIQEVCDKASGGCGQKQGAWLEADTNETEKQNEIA